MSTLIKIATLQQSMGLRQIVARQAAEAEKLTQEVATGMKKDVFSGSAVAGTRSLSLRSHQAANGAYMEANEVLQGRLQSMADALTAISEQARSFQSLTLSDAMRGSSREIYRLQAEHTLGQIVNFTNTTHGGDHVFSGLGTDQKAVEVTAAPPPAMAVTYLGGPGTLSAQIDDGTKMSYGLSATDPAFTRIFDALTTVLNTDLAAMTPAAFDTLRESVATTLADGLQSLTSRQAALGNHQQQLQDRIDAQYALDHLYMKTVTGIEGVDVEEAAVRLQSMQVQLRATYEVTARLGRMTLLDYL
ncbi:flagellin [Marivita sp.]|uniref:flagellin n=1 Tax=Marivita sp. TaxID=2003365 RepID=UPI0025BBE8F4|nr:flagellin [Marivita sp.]